MPSNTALNAMLGARIRETLGDIDPLNKVPFKRATRRVQKGPLQGVSLILPRNCGPTLIRKALLCTELSLEQKLTP